MENTFASNDEEHPGGVRRLLSGSRRPARSKKRSRRIRVQLDLLPEVYERVIGLQRRFVLDSVRTVFRLAFKLLEWYLVRRSEGWSIQLVRDGQVVFVDLDLEGGPPQALNIAAPAPHSAQALRGADVVGV